MGETTNLKLTKPSEDDFYDVNVQNENMDIIDEKLLSKTGDASNTTNTFTQATTKANLSTGEKTSISFGKLMKWFADLKSAAWAAISTTASDFAANGTASPGSTGKVADAGHIHPTDATRQAKITANGILKGDGSGGVAPATAGSDYIAPNGNAATATKLQTARNINITDDVTGSTSFDGSGNVSIKATLSNTGVTPGTYGAVTVDEKGRVTGASNAEGSNTVALTGTSHAEGGGAVACTPYSHAEGLNTLASNGVSYNITTFDNSAKTVTLDNVSGLSVGTLLDVNVQNGSSLYNVPIVSIIGLVVKLNTTATITASFVTVIKRNTTLYGVHAEGSYTQASGNNAHAEGVYTIASGNSGAHSEGISTLASGGASHAEGNLTQATNSNAHSEGYQTLASGNSSHAEGANSKALGDYSHVEGSYNVGNTNYVHVEGRFNLASQGTFYIVLSFNDTAKSLTVDDASGLVVGDLIDINVKGAISLYDVPITAIAVNVITLNTTATLSANCNCVIKKTTGTNYPIHAEGYNNVASGDRCHVEGNANFARGNYSHAEGSNTSANGSSSHSEGTNTVAVGNNGSHAEGNGTIAVGNSSHTEGYGTVTGASAPSTSADITTLGSYAHAEGNGTMAMGNSSHSEGVSTRALGLSSHAEGNGTVAGDGSILPVASSDTTSGNFTHAEGNGTLAQGNSSHAEGKGSTSMGNYSHAEGLNTLASGPQSHAEGNLSYASGNGSHAEGNSTEATGTYSHAEGNTTKASGANSHSEGYNTESSGQYSHAEGSNVVASGVASHAQNARTIAQGYCQTAMGFYNVAQGTSGSFVAADNALIIGKGTSDAARANAFRVTFNGAVYGLLAYNSPGADYAEYFEWKDKNIDNEDRVGFIVTIDGDKIRKAISSDEFILGVISATPSVIGDSHQDEWNNKNVMDKWGRIQYEWSKIEISETVVNEETGDTEEVIKEIDAYVPIINPDYDPTQEYIPREQRPEWSAVGMMGKLFVRDDGTCEVNRYCWSNDEGIATKSATGYRVLKRVSENIIQVLIK